MISLRDSRSWYATAAFLILWAGPRPAAQAQLTRLQELPPWLKPWTPSVVPDDYTSPGNIHKIEYKASATGPASLPPTVRPNAQFSNDQLQVKARLSYDQLQLWVVDRLPPGAVLRDTLNLIRLRGRFIDTTLISPPEMPDPCDTSQLRLVQFVGPPQSGWLEDLRNMAGLEIVSYLPENAYLVWANQSARDKLRSQTVPPSHLQWEGRFHPAYKLYPGFDLNYPGNVQATIQLFSPLHSSEPPSLAMITQKANRILREVQMVGRYENISVEIRASDLAGIAQLENVVNIEPCLPGAPMDERQGQILAGNLDVTSTGPVGPGYLTWLNSLGFTANFDFVVDVADTGFDRGEAGANNPAQVHPVFRDAAGLSRVAYVRRISGKSAYTNYDEDADGHGTLSASIVGGFADPNASDPDYLVDSGGFLYGLGIAPYVRIGSTDIWASAPSVDYTTAIDLAYADGARISSNSWGDWYGPFGWYDDISELYDHLVRDARPASTGGPEDFQEMVVVFAAGNNGPGQTTLGNKGATAKNTIVVGACENYNPAEGWEGDGNPDPIGDTDADNPDQVTRFSSRGPTRDGRKKPDLVAPGTHIYGAVSQHASYNGDGVTGAPGNLTWDTKDQHAGYYPSGQTLYTWSSGTSHAAPAVAGGAALLRQWFINKGYVPPSPAMTKAYLMNSATYIKGPGDDLPSVAQGMGRMDLGRALDDTPRLLRDQTWIFERTATGAADRFTIKGRVADSNRPFRVTMAYTDAPGTRYAETILENDLDLEVEIGGLVYLGNFFDQDVSQPSFLDDGPDHYNNVESVFLPAGATGEFTVTVRPTTIGANALDPYSDNMDRQDFALVIYNAEATTQEPADVVLVLDASGSMNEIAAGGTRPKIDLLKDAVELFIRTWEPFSIPSDRLAVVCFSDAASTYPRVASGPALLPFRQNADRFIEYVRRQTAGGCSTLGGGILTALRSLDHQTDRQRQIIVVTNDMQNRSPMVTSVYPTAHQILADPEAPCGTSGIADEPSVDLRGYDIEAIHTVGTGTPGDWAILLANIASETGGQCRFTTTPDKDLEGLLLENLAGVLQIDSVASAAVATGTLVPGQTIKVKEFPINTTVRRATFVVSWTGVRNSNAVDVALKTPDGRDVPRPLIDQRSGSFYQILSVAFPLSEYPHAGLWTVALTSTLPGGRALEYRIRNLVDDDSIRCQVSVPTANLRAGELLPISVSLRQGNRVLRGPQSVRATITRPPEGFGTFMVNHRLDPNQLQTPVDLGGDVFPNLAQQQAYLLLQNDRLRELLTPVTETIGLYDDGQPEHGDARRDDGVFSTLYRKTFRPGFYRIELSVRRQDGQDTVYRRESRTVVVEIGPLDPDKSTITLREVENLPGEPPYYEATVIYIDRLGNYLGPGHNDLNAIISDRNPDKWNVKRVPLHDNLDGSYSGRLGPVVGQTGVASPPASVRIEMGGFVAGEARPLYTR